MPGKSVLLEQKENISIITLNRPERLNAVTPLLLSELLGVLEAVRADVSVRAAVLTGAGRAFCAGEDLKEAATGKTPDQWMEEAHMLSEVQRAFMKLGKPVIAAVAGYALGAGAEFAMGCDLRIAAENAVFGFPETGVGLTVTNAGTKLLTQLVGLGKARELVLTGDFIDAAEARRIGLVNRVAPAADLMQAALDMAGKIAARSPLAVRLSRIALDAGMSADFDTVMELEAAHLLACGLTGGERIRERLSGIGSNRTEKKE